MMTRKQAEANWGWSPKRGSIPFKRPRPTSVNICEQMYLARPRKLVHWAYVGTQCERKNSLTDQWVKGAITFTGEASHIENVNCLACRKFYFASKRKEIEK